MSDGALSLFSLPMAGAILLGMATSVIAFGMHRQWRQNLSGRMQKSEGLAKQSAHFAEMLLSHLLAAGLFALAFALGVGAGLGSFEHDRAVGSADYFTFSLVNLTTLGLGDILVSRHLRVVAGIEALTGFLMLSCSAQLVWKQMNASID